MATFRLQRGAPQLDSEALRLHWRAADLAGTSDPYTPSSTLALLTGGVVVDDPQVTFDLQAGEPPSDPEAVLFSWGQAGAVSLTLAGSSAPYAPQSGTLDLPRRVRLFLAGSSAPYYPQRFRLDLPGAGLRLDLAGSSGPYFPPLGDVGLPRDGSQQATYPPEPPPGVIQSVRVSWGAGVAREAPARLPHGDAPERDQRRRTPWGQGYQTAAPVEASWDDLERLNVAGVAAWQQAPPMMPAGAALPFGDPPAKGTTERMRWDESVAAADAWDRILWGDPPERERAAVAPWRASREHPLREPLQPPYVPEPADAVNFDLAARPPAPQPAPYVPGSTLAGSSAPYVPSTALGGQRTTISGTGLLLEWQRFEQRLPGAEATDTDGRTVLAWGDAPQRDRSARLPWGRGGALDVAPFIPWIVEDPEQEPEEPDRIPEQETYTVNSTATVTRVSDGAVIEVLSITAGISAGEFAWRARLALADSDSLERVRPTGGGVVEVDIEINGWHLLALVESWSRETTFGQQTWVAQCRGVSAELDAPYFAPRDHLSTQNATAAQLAAEELAGTGWAIAWPANLDWPIDAGDWAYQQMTPIRAVNRLASAVGAHVLPASDGRTLNVLSRLPHKPADWGLQTPAAIIPQSPVVRIGHTYEPRPAYDAIQITGGTQGVTVDATKQGAAGHTPAPEIVDELVTESGMAQERARVELYSSGPRSVDRRQLPVMPPVGVRLPGELVRNDDTAGSWIGLVESVQVSAAWRQSDGLVVWQTLTQDRRDAL